MKVFLSHSNSDKSRVQRIKSDLETHHIECWIDEDKIPFGGSITEHIESGLSESDIIMVFLSKKSVTSRWVKVEWQAMFFNQINEKNITIIPVLLEKCDMPLMLKSMRYLDFSTDSFISTI